MKALMAHATKLKALFYAGLSGVLSLTLAIQCARIFGAREYSWFVLGLAVGSLLIPLLNLGADRTLVRDLTQLSNDVSRSRLVARNLVVRIGVLVALSLLIALVACYYNDGVNGHGVSLWAISLWALLQGLYPFSLYDYKKLTSAQNKLTVFERVLALAMVYLFALLGNNDGMVLLAFLLLMSRLLSLFVQYYIWAAQRTSLRYDFSELSMEKEKGINFSVAVVQVSSAIVFYANQFYLKSGNHVEQLAMYGMILQIINVALVFQGQSLRLVSKEISDTCRHPSKEKIDYFFRHVKIIAGVSVVFSMITWVCVWLVSVFLHRSDFKGMDIIAVPLCIWTIFAGVGLVVSQYLIGLNCDKNYLKINVVGGGGSLLLGYVFVPQYGAMSAALILLLVHGAMILAQFRLVMTKIDSWRIVAA